MYLSLWKAKSALWQRVSKPGEALPPPSVSEPQSGFGSCMYKWDRNNGSWKQVIMWFYLAFRLSHPLTRAFHWNKVGFALRSHPAADSRRPVSRRERWQLSCLAGTTPDLQAGALRFSSWRTGGLWLYEN